MARTEYKNGNEVGLVHNGCDGCSPSTINGIICHEQGCPDSWKDKTVDCFVCGCDFYPQEKNNSICEDCENDY